MNRISQAICFATQAFDGKFRKGENMPVIFHSLEVAAIVQSFCCDEDVVCSALLHDTVEDAGVKLSNIKEMFGERVAFLVKSETEEKYPSQNPADTWLRRKQDSIRVLHESTDRGVRALWLADKLANLRSFSVLKKRLGEDMWDIFNQKDPMAHKKYYRSIADELTIFADTDAYAEYIALIENVFGKEEENGYQM